MIRNMTPRDVTMFKMLEALKEESRCIDKQVACIICNDEGVIVAQGVNTILDCDKNCHDKEKRVCKVVHAEQMAVRTLAVTEEEREAIEGGRIYKKHRTAYVSLFPCAACQRAILPYVDEIVTYGMIHKDWVSGDKLTVFPHMSYTLLNSNGRDGQRVIAAGELAELITAISDVFQRTDRDAPIEDLLDEIVDVEMQLDMLKIMAHEKNAEAFNLLRDIRGKKYARVLEKYGKVGISSYTT